MNNLNSSPDLGSHQKHPINTKEIPGWGADLNPLNRPGVPREEHPGDTGAHWAEPEQQQTEVRIFQSVERPMITPVFGTTCPPKMLSGKMRTWAYRLGEGKKKRWMLLLAADRVDVVESLLTEFFVGRLNERGKRVHRSLNWVLLGSAIVGSAALAHSLKGRGKSPRKRFAAA
jgi:hypothetical protein